MWTNRTVRFATCVLAVAGFVLLAGRLATRADAGNQKVTAKLERLKTSPGVLKPPSNVKGDFQIAETPPKIDFAIFPGQWEGARLWSSWGDSLFASDGNFYASIGDHGTPHGTAYVYRINPEEKTVTRVVDINKVVGISAKDKYTPGKIHAPLVEDPEGNMYIFGYRGSVRNTGPKTGYKGDWLLRYRLSDGTIENLGIPIAYCSVPVLSYHEPSHSLYGMGAPGQTAPKSTERFFRYDLKRQKPIFVGGPEPAMSRALFLTHDGRAYYSVGGKSKGESHLVRYDPEANAMEGLSIRTPGEGPLRAASRPNKKGIAYGISRDGVVFRFDMNDEALKRITRAFVAGPQYTAVCRLGPNERYLYYIPGAHGGTSRAGTPVIQLDLQTGQRKVLAFLNALLRQKKNYNLGGTYGIALNADGSQLCINWNGSHLPPEKHEDFGRCSAMILHIPADERAAGK